MDDTLVQLIKAIQDIAPQVWNIYMKQVTVELFQYGLFLVLLFGIGVIGFQMARKGWEDLDEFSKPLTVLIGLVFIILLVGLSCDFIGRLVNPEYYAIQMLLEVVSGN